MRTARWAIGLALVGAMLPRLASAQAIYEESPSSGSIAAPVGMGNNSVAVAPDDVANVPPPPPMPYYAMDSATVAPAPAAKPARPSAAAPAPQAATPAPASADMACYDCQPGPWRVPQPCFFQQHGITWGGWAQMGATVNGWNPPSHFNGPVATNDRNEFEMNQLWIYMDKPVNTGGCGWDVGGHIDIAYGTDWRFGRNWGLESRIDSADQLYGLILPQYYMSVGINDLTVKMGHFAPGFGYESIPAPSNFFYSHSYALSFTEPLLVTGLQADYKLSDQWTLVGGFNRGWMMYEDLNTSLDVVGGVRWASQDKDTQFAFMTTTGPQGTDNDHNRFAYSMVIQQQLGERWQYVFQHNLGVEDGTSTVSAGGQAAWYGIDQYLFYTINEKWKAGLRFEWLQDADGTRVAGVGNWIGSDRGWTALPGFAGDFYEVTLGLNWRPRPNFVLRPEVRWDWYGGSRNLDGQLPFNDGLNASQFTAAMDLIVTF